MEKPLPLPPAKQLPQPLPKLTTVSVPVSTAVSEKLPIPREELDEYRQVFAQHTSPG
jgi:hypothetical protein